MATRDTDPLDTAALDTAATSGVSTDVLVDDSGSTAMVMALAAVGAALVAMFGDADAFTVVTVAAALCSLVPWAIEAGGVRLPSTVFMAGTLVPAAVIVLIDRNPGGMFLAMITVVRVTHTAASRIAVAAVLGISVALTVGLAVLERTTHETGTVYFLGGAGVSWLAGSMLRRQSQLTDELRRAHAQQSAHAASAERTRIAREVHDVVAHSLTVTMLHVAGARRALATDPDGAAKALARAETVGRESLDSIRSVVGLLRTEAPPVGGESSSTPSDASAPARSLAPPLDTPSSSGEPMPGLDDVSSLVESYRSAGLVVTGSLELDGLSVDATTGLTVYRVVQEALSNALQYAPGAPVTLDVRRESAGSVLRITAENPAVPPATGVGSDAGRSGLGLLGMSERVRAVGGSVEVGPTAAGSWRVDAVLPLRRTRVDA